MTEQMINKITAYIKQHHMIQKGDHIIVGVSGGADSVCLFLVLERLRSQIGFTMSVVHIEHGIRGDDSLEDMLFVRRLAEEYGVPVVCHSYPVKKIAKDLGISIEEAGRKVRYEAFGTEAEKWEGTVKTAVAHHADDCAETLLFHLCRGSGIEGLAGIRPVRDGIIRPLLCVGKAEIEAFLKEERQPCRTDATNADIRYSRNRIRRRILPELLQVNNQAVAHMNRLAEDAVEISSYLKQEADKILKRYMKKTGEREVVFDIREFLQYPSVLQSRLMLELAAEVSGSRKDIAREHIKALIELAGGGTGRRISLPYGITAEKSYDFLRLYSGAEYDNVCSILEAVPVENISGEMHFPMGTIQYRIFDFQKKDLKIPKNVYTKWFDYDKIKNRLYFRTREPGDYFVIDSQGHRKKLKDYWMDEKIPKSKRNRILLLADGAHILWAVGGRISEYYKVAEQTKRVLEVQYMEEKL